MKICNKVGCGVCVGCDRIPPSTNGISHGDICRKTVKNIMNYLEDGEEYAFNRAYCIVDKDMIEINKCVDIIL